LSTFTLEIRNGKQQEEGELNSVKEFIAILNTQKAEQMCSLIRLPSGNMYSSNLNPDLNSEEYLWRNISRKNQMHIENMQPNKLEKYDVIKIGKFMLFISDLVSNYRKFYGKDFILSNENLHSYDSNNHLRHESYKLNKLNGTMENMNKLKLNSKILDNNLAENHSDNFITCRICYSIKSTNEDPLISLCNCIGSVRFMHYTCLQKWLRTRIKIKEGEKVITIKCRLYCEICKSTLPSNYHYLIFSKISFQ
jgi:hypothetical protein